MESADQEGNDNADATGPETANAAEQDFAEGPDLNRVDAYKPVSAGTSPQGYSKPSTSFVENGMSQLEDFICEAIGRLDDATKADMHLAAQRCFQIGTACSGTDVAALVVKGFARAWSKISGKHVDFNHLFSCELDDKKRDFIHKMFTGTSDACDVQLLLRNSADLICTDPNGYYDCLSGQSIRDGIPVCSDLMVGFPCQDVSRLNPSAESARWVIRDSGRRTGKVFSDVMEYCKHVLQDSEAKQVFRGLLLENVLGLLSPPKGTNPETGESWHSNLDYCERAATGAGLILIPCILDPKMFGIPVSRQRVWMVCIPTWMATAANMSKEDVVLMAHRLLDRLCDDPTIPCRSLNDFLLPASHELVRSQNILAEQSRKKYWSERQSQWSQSSRGRRMATHREKRADHPNGRISTARPWKRMAGIGGNLPILEMQFSKTILDFMS